MQAQNSAHRNEDKNRVSKYRGLNLWENAEHAILLIFIITPGATVKTIDMSEAINNFRLTIMNINILAEK